MATDDTSNSAIEVSVRIASPLLLLEPSLDVQTKQFNIYSVIKIVGEVQDIFMTSSHVIAIVNLIIVPIVRADQLLSTSHLTTKQLSQFAVPFQSQLCIVSRGGSKSSPGVRPPKKKKKPTKNPTPNNIYIYILTQTQNKPPQDSIRRRSGT